MFRLPVVKQSIISLSGVNEEILRGYDDLADALFDALNQPMPFGADILSAAFNLLATDMADGERVLLFRTTNRSWWTRAVSVRAKLLWTRGESLEIRDSRRDSVHCFCDRRGLLQTQINAAPRRPPRRRLAKRFTARSSRMLRVCNRCSHFPGPCKSELFAPFLAILTNLRRRSGSSS